MSEAFDIDVLSFEKISKIKNAWTADDYKALLAMIDIDEDELGPMSESELKEMCLMSLNDLEPHESAELLLTHIFKDDITAGKIDQLSHQMIDNNLWEEHADPAYHMSLFNAYGLLREAYNGIFAEPTGVRFTIKINVKNEDSFDIFEPSLHAVIVRLLASGMNEGAILNRLFEDQINGAKFPLAKSILWKLSETSNTAQERQYDITSSYLWFGELENIESFEANAHADGDEDEIEDN